MSKDDKTEKPTAKKKRDSRQKGQIAKSQDLTSWVSLLFGLYLIPFTVGRIAAIPADTLNMIRTNTVGFDSDIAIIVLGTSLRDGFIAIAPFLAAVVATSVMATMGQTGLMLSLKPLKPDFKRISPKAGFKRLFSVRSAWETVKQLLKISVVLVLAWPRLMALVEDLAGHGRLALGTGLEVAGAGVMGLVRTIAWTMVGLSFADYGYQRYQNSRDLKMTKKEVRDEHRNAEGDAMVKGRIRQLQRSMARNRMLAGMGDADVIITNPTHIAVALRYDPAVSRAPIVLAVGANAVAAKIRERGHDLSIPIVEAKPLARALWRACDPGDEIPSTTYEAVAQVLAFVRRLDRRFALGRRRLSLPAHLDLGDVALEGVARKKRRRR